MGRVLLAQLPPEQLDVWFQEFTRLKPTARAIDDPAELRAEIERARETGYAVAIDQLDYGVAAIAAPIRGPGGEVVAAINSSGYTGLVTRKALVEERLPQLRACAAALAQVLSATPRCCIPSRRPGRRRSPTRPRASAHDGAQAALATAAGLMPNS